MRNKLANEKYKSDDKKMGPRVRPREPRSHLWLRRVSLLVLVGFLSVEGYARWALGLGDPPLSRSDPDIEYLFQPGTYHRFGNLVYYNGWSMRSEDFPLRKADPSELRIMVFGDSVINGGSQTDQSDLATELLRDQLQRDLGRKTVIGNISAGSWGPPNQLAYARKYGLFDADLVVIVLSSHDYADVPTFKPVVGIDPDFPDHAPLLALQEVIMRYLPHYLSALWRTGSLTDTTISESSQVDQREVSESMSSLRELIDLARSRRAKVLLAQYPEHDEAGEWKKPGYYEIRQVAEVAHVPTMDLAPAFGEAMKHGENPYRDAIHPNVIGQHIMAGTLLQPIKEIVADSHALCQFEWREIKIRSYLQRFSLL